MSWPDTYSQFDEQQAILRYFEPLMAAWSPEARPTFLDVGAWDPKCFSNTRALFERGWSGVMIEPSPTPMLSLLKEYGNEPKITLVQAAVGLEDSILPFQISDDGLSTSDQQSFRKWKETGGFYGRMYVRTITWQQIAVWYGGFTFINLDAEGISVDLFHEMVSTGIRPACCCVEHDGRLTELAAAATSVGYKAVYVNGTNAVFTL
jgi:FkbM family methyltransferase